MSGGLYRVVGTRCYRGHQPGDLFEATIEPRAEARAIGRGDIALLERIRFTVQPGSYTLPKGWLTQGASDEQKNRPEGLRRG